jgi:hypothetical protein
MYAALEKPLWTCPDCGHQFVTRNIWHSCINFPLEKHFEGKSPEVIALYHHYLGLIHKIGPVNIEPIKTRIAFLVRVRFGGAVLREKWLEARLWLKHSVQHPCLRRIEKVCPRDFIHYFGLSSVDEMGESFVSFLRESYAIRIQEDLMEGQESGS